MSIGKRTRFKVFDRDGYKCRYCGRTPDDNVILEVDHVIAKANGGTDDIENLVTSCFDCNRGKSDLEIGSAPETDSARWARLQELAEIKRAAQEVSEISAQREKLREEWCSFCYDQTRISSWPNSFLDILIKLQKEFGTDTVADWACAVVAKFDFATTSGVFNGSKYLNGIARNQRERGE